MPWCSPSVLIVERARSFTRSFCLDAALARHFRNHLDARHALELPAIVEGPGPVFTVLRVEPETDFLGTPPMTFEGAEMKYRFGRALERRLCISVFGPQGY